MNSLDDIEKVYEYTGLLDPRYFIEKAQNEYIESRIRWFWRLPLVRNFTSSKIILTYSSPQIAWDIRNKERPLIMIKMKAMVVGKTEFWALRILKRL